MSGIRAINSARRGHTRAVIDIGTAGWSVASRYVGDIPAGGSHLERYGRAFPIVEIDTSFYRHHRTETYERWAHSVGSQFRFAVKTPRALTHEGALVTGKSPELANFVEEIAGLGEKLRVVLVQLPPGLVYDAAEAGRFFRRLKRSLRDTTIIVCEPRHPSWNTQRAADLFADLGISRAAVDPPRWEADARPGGDTRLVYVRMHGSPRIYYSDYDAKRLERLHEALVAWSRTSEEIWCIFDNTAHGHALGNALTVRNQLA